MILKIEELSMNAWPSLQTNLYDGWVLRFSQGYTKRANSISPIYSSTIIVEEKINNCENIYSAKKLPIVYKITEACYPKNLDHVLESKGYSKIDETSVRILNISDNYIIEDVYGLDIEYNFTQEWIDSFVGCSNISDKSTIEVMTKMLKNIIGEKICANIKTNSKIVACGFGVIEDNYVGIFDIIVSKESRGKGYGKAIMQGILKEVQKKSIHNAYLQVVVGNSIAENLYDKLGFKEIYRYWYRIKHN
jgi:ribosomal protein S18 acetylase RimI-like enzyme